MDTQRHHAAIASYFRGFLLGSWGPDCTRDRVITLEFQDGGTGFSIEAHPDSLLAEDWETPHVTVYADAILRHISRYKRAPNSRSFRLAELRFN